MLNNENKKQVIRLQMTFILEIKPQDFGIKPLFLITVMMGKYICMPQPKN